MKDEIVLAWAQGVLDDAMEYPRQGEGWPNYSADEATADAVLRAAGLAWMLPACEEETTEQAAQRLSSEEAARARRAREEAEEAAYQARREAAYRAERREQLQSEWVAGRRETERRFGDLRDARGVRVAVVERRVEYGGRMSSLGGWSSGGTATSQGEWRAEDHQPVMLPLVCADNSRERTVHGDFSSSARSDWLPGVLSGDPYGGDAYASTVWSDLLGDAPDALTALEWRRIREAKAARKRPEQAAPASPFAALAALRFN